MSVDEQPPAPSDRDDPMDESSESWNERGFRLWLTVVIFSAMMAPGGLSAMFQFLFFYRSLTNPLSLCYATTALWPFILVAAVRYRKRFLHTTRSRQLGTIALVITVFLGQIAFGVIWMNAYR